MEVSIDPNVLSTMKYAALRKLAKSVGIKANMKADKLVKALEEYAAKQSIDTGKVSTPKAATPKVLTPLRKAVGTPRVSTPLRSPFVKAVTPLSLPRSRPSTPKVLTPLHRLRTPPSSRRTSSTLLTPSGSARKQATPNVASASRKRSRSAGGDVSAVSSAKKQRTEKAAVEEGDVTTRRRRSRTNTYDKEQSNLTSSPGTLDLIDSMAETLTEAERKEKLMAALDKKVQDKIGDGKQGTQIPRFVAFCALKKQEASVKKQTPGEKRYGKAHARHFSKMESLDQYIENKKKRVENIAGSAQKAKVMADQTSSALKKLKTLTASALSAKKIDAKAKLFKTPSHHAGVPFSPQVTSVSKVNFNFSTKTPGSVAKDSRRSPRLNMSMKDKENKDKPAPAARQKSMGTSVTPFKFKANLNQSHNSSLNKSAHKSKFDLAASLNRPITWKPHVGKLKPLEPVKTFRKDVKAVKVTTKEDRRQQAKANQAQKRQGAQMARRGLAA